MALYGPTPADWASQQSQSRDEQMRQTMNMILAAKNYQQEQQRYQTQLEHQGFQENQQMYRDDLYRQSIEQRADPQTEMQRNYDWLLQNDPNLARQYVEKQVKPATTGRSEYDFSVDDWTAGDMEKTLKLPPGTVKNAHPRQVEGWFREYNDQKYPKPGTGQGPAGQTPYSKQVAAIESSVTALETALAPMTALINKLTLEEANVPEGLDSQAKKLRSRINGMRQYRDMAATRDLTQTEWQSYMKLSAGVEDVDGGGDQADEIAKEMGLDPAFVRAWLADPKNSARISGGSQGTPKAPGPAVPQQGLGLREK